MPAKQPQAGFIVTPDQADQHPKSKGRRPFDRLSQQGTRQPAAPVGIGHIHADLGGGMIGRPGMKIGEAQPSANDTGFILDNPDGPTVRRVGSKPGPPFLHTYRRCVSSHHPSRDCRIVNRNNPGQVGREGVADAR